MAPASGEITQLLRRWSEGEDDALERLVEIAYEDLRAIARRQLRSVGGHPTLRTTALVHEVYVRLARADEGIWPSRGHFFAFCARAMRHVLVDYSRRHRAAKRGGSFVRVEFTAVEPELDSDIADVLAVDEALRRLEAHDERMARIVECRFFGGLTVAETAEALDVSVRTVERGWQRARTYLYRALDPTTGALGAGEGGPLPEPGR